MKVMITNNEWILIIICVLIGIVIIAFFFALVIDSRREYKQEMRKRYDDYYYENERKKRAYQNRPRPHEAYLIDDRTMTAKQLVGGNKKTKEIRPPQKEVVLETHRKGKNGRDEVTRTYR